jgi:hypothetical protein
LPQGRQPEGYWQRPRNVGIFAVGSLNQNLERFRVSD